MKTSLVILTANRAAMLMDCLAGVASGTRVPDEVVVVDNQSRDDSRTRLSHWAAPFSLRVIDGPGGAFAEARNAGVAATTGDAVLFLDDDTLPDGRWLERMALALEDADCVGGALHPADPIAVPDWWVPDLNWLVGLDPDSMFTDWAGRVCLPVTANLGFRRWAWEADPFQELGGEFASRRTANFPLGREDAQWWRRQRHAGRRCVVERRAIAWHRIGPDRFDWPTVLARARGDGRAHWHRERPEHDIPFAAGDVVRLPLSIAGDMLRQGVRFESAHRRHRLWTARQAALLDAAVNDGDLPVDPKRRTSAYVREFTNAARDLAKAPFRIAAVHAHHAFKHVRPLPSRENPPVRVVVVIHDFLGDAILSIPMVESLRRSYPGVEVALVTGSTGRGLFEGTPHFDCVLAPGRSRGSRDLRWAQGCAAALREFDPDAILLAYCHGALPLPIFAATDAPVVCWEGDNGMMQRVWPELARVRVAKNLRKPEVASLMELLGPIGATGRLARPRYLPPEAAVARARSIREKIGLETRRFAVIHLESAKNPKYWEPKRWVAVAKRLHSEFGLRTVFEGSPGARGLGEFASARVPGSVTLHGVLSAAELGALQADAALCLGADSGPQHLSQAVGTPTIILFGPQDEQRWGPLPQLPHESAPPAHRVVRAAPRDWHPTESAGLPDRERLDRISVEHVWEAVTGVLRSALA